MNMRARHRWVLIGLLVIGPLPSFASDVILTAAEAEGSALPPGINPSSPAGGNGGDAQGYDKKPLAPPPPGTQKTIAEPAPATPYSVTPKSERDPVIEEERPDVKKR